MNLHKATLALTKVNFNSLPTSILPHVTYSSVYVPGKHQKMSMFIHLLGLSNLNPRRSQLSVAVMLSAPGFGQLRASDSDVSHMLEAGTVSHCHRTKR